MTLLKTRFPLLYAGLVHKWFFDHLTNKFILRLLRFARVAYIFGDKGFIELVLGAKSFFVLFFSSFRLFLSKFIFGVALSEALLITFLVVSLFLTLSFIFVI